MAKKGLPIPDAIRQFVLETKQNAPGLAHRQIADKVEEKFGEGGKIDKTSVGRILKEAGFAGRYQIPVGAPQTQKHRDGLTDEARSLGSEQKGPTHGGLDGVLVEVSQRQFGKGWPSGLGDTYYWVLKVRLENVARSVATLGDFELDVIRGDEVHVLPHLDQETYGSRGGVPHAEEALGQFVALTAQRPVAAGFLRFVDDAPFGQGEVSLTLRAKGTGRFRGAEITRDIGSFEAR